MSASNNPAPVITIDGPSGSGKGTAAALVAGHFGFHLLDSGALYRVLAVQCLRHEITAPEQADADRLHKLALQLPVTFKNPGNAQQVLLEDDDISAQIRTEEVGAMASRVATIPAVRSGLLDRQRAFRQPPGLVADGRDMGTVVFADAPAKLFLDASAEIRAKRRCKQLSLKEEKGIMDGLLRTIRQRDERDRNRAVAPLLPADDALRIDTSDLDIAQVVAKIVSFATPRLISC